MRPLVFFICIATYIGILATYSTPATLVLQQPAVSEQRTEQTTTQEVSNMVEQRENTVVYWDENDLQEAVSQGDTEKVREILRSGTVVLDTRNEKQETPLLIAVHNNNIEIAKLLIHAGADINAQDMIQDSPYLYAGAEGRTEILAYMLAHATPDYGVYNRYGGNALIPAAEKGHVENVALLLEDGREDINRVNHLGYTALIEVALLSDGSPVYSDITKLLLEYGADATITDFQGKTALDYAEQNGYDAIAQAIRNQRG